MMPAELGERTVTIPAIVEVTVDDPARTFAAFALVAMETLNSALREEMAAIIALMVDVTAEPERTSIGMPAVSVGMDWTASMPPPTSFDFMVMIWLHELMTVKLSAI